MCEDVVMMCVGDWAGLVWCSLSSHNVVIDQVLLAP